MLTRRRFQQTGSRQWRLTGAGLATQSKEAVRQLLIHNELTERQAVRHLQDKGIAIGMQSVFAGIASRMGLVQRTFQGSTGKEHVHGYEGTYQANLAMREPLRAIIDSEG